MQLKILHVSDFHFKKQSAWESRPILKKLIKSIKDSPHKPDLIAVTGDIAYHGLASEYALAKPFFENLLEACQLSTNELFMVPGNHDVNRKVVCEDLMVKNTQAMILQMKKQDDVAQIFANAQHRTMMLARHAAYADFVHELTGRAEGSYWVRSLTKDGLQIGIAGFNSAWMSWQKEEAGKLLLGQYQLNQLTKDLDNYPLRLALLHHPKDFLASWDRTVWDQMAVTFHMILRGHLHETEIVQANNKRHSWLEVAAGSAYSHQTWSNAFHWIHLDVQSGETIIEPWVWFQNTWQRERNLFSDPDQCAVFQLGQIADIQIQDAKPKSDILLADQIRTAMKSWFDRWELGNLGAAYGPDGKIIQTPLEDIFQPLRIASAEEIGKSWGESKSPGKVFTAKDLLKLETPLIITGVAGAGKTTWMRHIFRELLAEPKALPLMLELRGLVAARKDDPDLGVFEYLTKTLRQKGSLKIQAEDLETFVHEPKDWTVVLLVDGWDELGDRCPTSTTISGKRQLKIPILLGLILGTLIPSSIGIGCKDALVLVFSWIQSERLA